MMMMMMLVVCGGGGGGVVVVVVVVEMVLGLGNINVTLVGLCSCRRKHSVGRPRRDWVDDVIDW